jgi:predicted dehydrogenase
MRWGIAGYGDIVIRRVLPALRHLGEEPLYLWGRDPLRAARTAAAYGIPSSGGGSGSSGDGGGGGERAAALPEGLDALYVATPVVRHVPWAAAGLDAGLHVLIEKPLAGAVRPGGGGLVAALAPGGALSTGGARGPCAGVAYYRRLAPAVRALRAELAGWSPERVELRFRCAFAPGPDDPMRWRTDPAVSGGGVLADAGSHRLDLLLTLFGRPDEVRARLGDRFSPAGAERRAEVALRWPSGLRAHCLLEWDQAPPVDSLTLRGGGRALTLDPLDSGQVLHAGPDGRRRARYAPPPNPHVPLIADFAAASAAGRPPVCPVAEAVLVDDVIVAANRSDAAGGAPVTPWPQ